MLGYQRLQETASTVIGIEDRLIGIEILKPFSAPFSVVDAACTREDPNL